MSTRRGRGFTLIELLVVIAIIGILAAMLFPVFARARESARKTQCLANIKNLTLALMMYADDYDGTVGGWGQYCEAENPAWRSYWWIVLEPYYINKDILRCPSNGWSCCAMYQPDLVASGAVPTINYGMTTCTIAPPPGVKLGLLSDGRTVTTTDAAGNPVTHEVTISDLILIADSGGPNLDHRGLLFPMGCGGPCCGECCREAGWVRWGSTESPHMGGINAGMADGHAKWFPRTSLHVWNLWKAETAWTWCAGTPGVPGDLCFP